MVYNKHLHSIGERNPVQHERTARPLTVVMFFLNYSEKQHFKILSNTIWITHTKLQNTAIYHDVCIHTCAIGMKNEHSEIKRPVESMHSCLT